jgi:hypothetical protein
VEQAQPDSSILGKTIWVMRVLILDPPKWFKEIRFDILVIDTLDAKRCEKKIVTLKRISTIHSNIYVIHKIHD